jgi:hypothetical protein
LCIASSCSKATPDVVPPLAPPDVPPIDAGDPDGGARTLQDLTQHEREALCDWTAAITGGYGKVSFCEGGAVVENQRDQDACLFEFVSGCYNLTIDMWITCEKKIATDPCAQFLYSAPECKQVLKCAGKRDGAPPQPDPDADTE